MKLVRYRTTEKEKVGLVREGHIFPLDESTDAHGDGLTRLIREWDQLADCIESGAVDPEPKQDEVEFLPPIVDYQHFIGIGYNYRAHVAEAGKEVPTQPTTFPRYPETFVGHGGRIERPKVSEQLDYEGELAVVIGRPGRYIEEADALDHVFGYTCFIDGSVRDYQRHATLVGKNFPRTGVLGPWIVTADEIGDPASLRIETRINGEVRQSAPVSEMIHSVPALIGYLSQVFTLQPGDMIATGTPAGAGAPRSAWLIPGDHIDLTISGIGKLSAAVVDEP